MTREAWAKDLISKQPVFDSKEKAIHAAIQANKKMAVYEVWQEPNGGRYIVASPESFETLYREKYKKILDSSTLVDIERGEHIDEIDEA